MGVMVSISKNTMTLSLLLMQCVISIWLSSSMAELQRLDHPVKEDGSLRFLVIGDWGRRGSFNQSQVAYQMGIVGEKLDISFVINTGDNFYDDGLKSVDDTAFEESFTNIYTAKSLQKLWYSVLGNHDYRGDAKAQLSPIMRKIDSRWICLRSFLLHAEIVEFFFIDTTPFVAEYFTDPGEHVYDWRDVTPRNKYISNVLKDLDSALRDSLAKWKIVVGHHTIKSVGHHGDTQELIDLLLPMLKAYNVDFYLNGHDHCLEQMTGLDSPIQFITSGAGSKAWRGDAKSNVKGLNFFYDGQGFMSMHLTAIDAEIVFYDVYGKVLYQWKTTKDLHFAM